MRRVIADVVDDGIVPRGAGPVGTNVVTGLGPLGGRPVGVVANQPSQRAGTLDIEALAEGRPASSSCCDAFGLPLVTLVDTPGFQPGRTWSGGA